MATPGFRKPVNCISQGDTVIETLQVGPNATAAKMLPGIAVMRDTNDYCVKEGDATFAGIGVLGFEYTNDTYRPLTIDTAYAVGDTVAVHTGPGRYRMRCAVSQTITKGMPLKIVADGYVAQCVMTQIAETSAVDPWDVFAKAEESITTDGSSHTAIWVMRR